jgi:hypothetical protein
MDKLNTVEDRSDDRYDYLAMEPTQDLLGQLTEMGKHLKDLKIKMLSTEAAAKQAKKEYEEFRSTKLPIAMHSAGMAEFKMEDGALIRVEHDFHCHPNKGEADRQKIVEWLRANGGDHLIKEQDIVPEGFNEKLKAAGIPFIEEDTINTTSLKAFLKGKLGISGKSVATLTLQDIPDCIHFSEVSVAEIII